MFLKIFNRIKNPKVKNVVQRTWTTFFILSVLFLLLVLAALSSLNLAADYYANNSQTKWIDISEAGRQTSIILYVILIWFILLFFWKELYHYLTPRSKVIYNQHKFYFFVLICSVFYFIPTAYLINTAYFRKFEQDLSFYLAYLLILFFCSLFQSFLFWVYFNKIQAPDSFVPKKHFFVILNLIFLLASAFVYLVVANSWLSILILFFVVAFNDVFAYFFGSFFGKTKVFKNITTKTIEGYVGGFITSLIAGVGVFILSAYLALKYNNQASLLEMFNILPIFDFTNIWNQSPFYWIILVLLFIGFNILAPMGDLYYSKVKRSVQIKDFSNCLGAHGGLLDRFDSQSFVFSFFLIFNLFNNITVYSQS